MQCTLPRQTQAICFYLFYKNVIEKLEYSFIGTVFYIPNVGLLRFTRIVRRQNHEYCTYV